MEQVCFAGSANFERDIEIVSEILLGATKQQVATKYKLNKDRVGVIVEKLGATMLSNWQTRHPTQVYPGPHDDKSQPVVGQITDMRKIMFFWVPRVQELHADYTKTKGAS